VDSERAAARWAPTLALDDVGTATIPPIASAVSANLRIIASRVARYAGLVPEVPVLGEDHRHAGHVTRLDHLGVAF
jgi:hypothetical protein